MSRKENLRQCIECMVTYHNCKATHRDVDSVMCPCGVIFQTPSAGRNGKVFSTCDHDNLVPVPHWMTKTELAELRNPDTCKDFTVLSGKEMASKIILRNKSTWIDVHSEVRKRPLVAIRAEIAHVLQTKYKWSLSRIGAILNRDHTTVMNLLDRHEYLQRFLPSNAV